jgi:hypothetical protein
MIKKKLVHVSHELDVCTLWNHFERHEMMSNTNPQKTGDEPKSLVGKNMIFDNPWFLDSTIYDA